MCSQPISSPLGCTGTEPWWSLPHEGATTSSPRQPRSEGEAPATTPQGDKHGLRLSGDVQGWMWGTIA